MYNKADFSWVLAALIIAAALVYRRELWRALTPRNLATFAGSFAAGAGIFIAYNIRWPLISFRDGNPDRIAWWRPEVLWVNLQERAQMLFDLLNGTSMNHPIGIGPANVRPFSFGTPMGAVVIGAVLVALVIAVMPRQAAPRLQRPVRWMLLVMGLFFLCCAVTPAARGHHHVINIYPFPHILVGAVLAEGIGALAARLGPIHRRGLRLASRLVIALLVASNLLLLANTDRMLEATGGAGRWSGSVYALADDLRERPTGVPVHIMDWSIIWRVAVLLEGRVDGLDEPWVSLTNPDTAPRTAQRLLADPRAEYVVALPGTVAFLAAWQAMQEQALRRGYTVQVIETYHQRDGTPTMQRCRFVRAPARTDDTHRTASLARGAGAR